MIVVLPPSETKSAGGEGRLETAGLGYPELAVSRVGALDALDRLVALGQDESTPARARAAADNRLVRTSGVRPAIERYTGVLYDAMGWDALPQHARAWIAEHVVVQSALFGLVRATDRIPAYKVSSTTRLPGIAMRRHWASTGTALDAHDGLVLDLRSATYASLGQSRHAVSVDAVGHDGRALNHWNKHAKGQLVALMATAGVDAADAAELAEWASSAGVPLAHADGRMRLLATAQGLDAQEHGAQAHGAQAHGAQSAWSGGS